MGKFLNIPIVQSDTGLMNNIRFTKNHYQNIDCILYNPIPNENYVKYVYKIMLSILFRFYNMITTDDSSSQLLQTASLENILCLAEPQL